MQEIEEKRTEAQEIDYQIAALMEAGPEPEASKEDRAGRRRRLGGLVRGIWSGKFYPCFVFWQRLPLPAGRQPAAGRRECLCQ